MSESRWKLRVDQDGVTIAGDRFQLTTAPQEFTVDDAVFGVAESAEMEAIISELDAMTKRTYGQYCGLARAMEVLGERWALLVIRNLLVGPKTVAQLQEGLPRVPADVLAARLRELERTGIIRRQGGAESQNGDAESPVVYELSEHGRQLEDIVLRLSRWGAQMLATPRPEDIVTNDSMVMALRSTFQPEAAKGMRVSYELRMHDNDIIVHAKIDDGKIEAGAGSLPDPDLVISPGRVALKRLMTGELSPAEAIATGGVQLIGNAALLGPFTELFRIPRPGATSV